MYTLSIHLMYCSARDVKVMSSIANIEIDLLILYLVGDDENLLKLGFVEKL